MKKILILFLAMIALASCTDQERARYYGGSETINLPKGEKLVTVTWKDAADVWYLTRPMTANDSAETYTFYQSKGGMISFTGNGKIILIESK